MLGNCLAGKHEWAPLLLWIALGVAFFAHGAQKVFGWFGGYSWHGTMQYFTQTLHIPAPIVGVLTRWAALILVVQMVVAALLVHVQRGFFLNSGNRPNVGHGFEHNLVLIGTALAVVFAGVGA